MGWTEEQTLFADVNAIIVGFNGKLKMIQVQQGINPYAAKTPQLPPRERDSTVVVPFRIVDHKKLPKLTPNAFDMMFTGKPSKPEAPARRQPKRRGR